jgi:uncharacterized membrane protein YqhA
MRLLENTFETILFNSRLIVLIGVIGALVSAVVMFIKGGMQIVEGISLFITQISHFSPGAAHGPDHLVATLVASVDNFLFATVLIIFSMGLYELFVSKLDPAVRKDDSRPNWLKVNSLDDLKTSLGKVILMILVVSFFEHSLSIEYKGAMDLLLLGAGILLVSGALFLTHAGHHDDKHTCKDAGEKPETPAH